MITAVCEAPPVTLDVIVSLSAPGTLAMIRIVRSFDTPPGTSCTIASSIVGKAASESALVVFQSDSYADREWCRIEVLTAKSEGFPIVIVNAVQNGEKRAFPYLGNYPSIRFKENYQSIIDLTLEQVLFNKYTRKFLDSLTDLYNIKTDRILSNVPELFNFIQLKKQKITGEKYALVIYPDPPLGSEEIDILNQLDDDFVFITPLMLPSIAKRNEQRT